MSNKAIPPPLQPLITPTRDGNVQTMNINGNKTTKQIHSKRDKHPLIKMRFSKAMLNHSNFESNQKRITNKKYVQPQHPQIIASNKEILNECAPFSIATESDDMSCSELAYNTDMPGHDIDDTLLHITATIANDNNISFNIEDKEEEPEKYKAFVVMSGNTTAIESTNQKGEIIRIGSDNITCEVKEAIVLGECNNKMMSKCENAMIMNPLQPLVENVINEGSNLCLDENAFKTIENDVIPSECLKEKLNSYPSNPVTKKFSNYYFRNESIGGTLLQSQQIADKYVEKDTVRKCYRNNYQQNYIKKARKHCVPSDELTRIQIREDIRKMRNPKMDEIKMVLKAIGLKHFVNHKAYVDLYGNENEKAINVVQKTKKKRKQRNYDSDYEDETYCKNGYQQPQPHKKKHKMNDREPIKCNKCGKIFTLEVDLLLHRTNDKC
eukprot:203926_1